MTDRQAMDEILTVRAMYRTDTTPEQWGKMILGLGYILQNEVLSDHAQTILEATLDETAWRFALLGAIGKK